MLHSREVGHYKQGFHKQGFHKQGFHKQGLGESAVSHLLYILAYIYTGFMEKFWTKKCPNRFCQKAQRFCQLNLYTLGKILPGLMPTHGTKNWQNPAQTSLGKMSV